MNVACKPSERECDFTLNPVALRKAKIVYNFGLSDCNRVKAPKLN